MTFELSGGETASKGELYDRLKAQTKALFESERDFIANAANLSSLLFHSLPDVNWVGFYLLKEDQLVLGPFQGKPACVRIETGIGVCGTAAQLKETVIVENVNEFPGHIACDSASNSEIVIPIVRDERLIGVLDLDSPSLARFDQQDAEGLNGLVSIFVGAVDHDT